MISTDSKFHSSRNPIHQPLQIRTNKHRCFVFCIGHTSLTCVPGIGKKNKYLLNQAGIHDLSTLYSKYRAINNVQLFKQWLQSDIGFTSYQAKMTTCGIGSKLGEIKEINTGLTPIYCPHKLWLNDKNINKRNRSRQSKNDKNKEGIKKRKVENIKLENLSIGVNRDQTEPKQENIKSFNTPNKEDTIFSRKDDLTFSSSKEKLMNKLSDHHLIGVKSPDNRIYERTKLSKTKLMKSSSVFNETRRNDSNSLESTKQSSTSLEKNSKSNIHSSKISPSTSEQLKISKTPNNIDETLSPMESSNTSPEINFDILKSESDSDEQKTHEIQSKKSAVSQNCPSQQDGLTRSTELSVGNKHKSELQTSTNVTSPHFISPKDKVTNYQPSSHASVKDTHDNKTEQESPSGEKKSVSHFNLDHLTTDKSSVDKRSVDEMLNDQTKTPPSSISPLNDKTTKLNTIKDEKLNEIFTLTKQKLQPTLEALQDKKDELLFASKNSLDSLAINEYPKKSILHSAPSKSTSQFHTDIFFLAAIKQRQEQIKNKPFESIPTPETDRIKAIVNDGIDSNIKSKSGEGSPNQTDNKKSNLTPKMNQQTFLDWKFNATNITSPLVSSDGNSTTNELTPKSSNPSSPISNDKWQGSVSNRLHSFANGSQQEKFQQEISETVGEIMKHAAHITHRDIQLPQFNSLSSTKINSTDSPSILIPTVATKNHINTGTSVTLPAQQNDEQRPTPSKCVPLAERLAQAKVKELAVLRESKNKDARSLQLSELECPLQKNFLPFTFDRLKQSSTNTSSPDQSNQFKNNPPNMELKSAQVQQEFNNIPSITHPIDKMASNLTSPSSTGKKVLSDPGSNVENHSVKPSSTTSHKNDSLTKSVSMEIKPPISSINKSCESLKMQLFNKKKSLSTLSSLSDSTQSISRIHSSIDNIQSNSTNINHFEKDIEANANNDMIMSTSKNKFESTSPQIAEDLNRRSNLNTERSANKLPHTSRSLTISSPDIVQLPAEHGKQPSLDNTTLLDDYKNDKVNTPAKPSNHISQLPLSKNIKEDHLIKQNLSETANSKENSEQKHQIIDNHELKVNFKSMDSEQQSTSSPSSSIPCTALWDNISNEKILCQRRNHRFPLLRKNQSDQKTNQNNYNRNHSSSTTLFTYLTRDQHLNERQALDEHILYIKRIKTSNKK